MPRASSTEPFVIQVIDENGPVDLTGLSKVEFVLIDREDTARTMATTGLVHDETIGRKAHLPCLHAVYIHCVMERDGFLMGCFRAVEL